MIEYSGPIILSVYRTAMEAGHVQVPSTAPQIKTEASVCVCGVL